jgi:hypothetical protein
MSVLCNNNVKYRSLKITIYWLKRYKYLEYHIKICKFELCIIVSLC